jgi:predicted acyl esterase
VEQRQSRRNGDFVLRNERLARRGAKSASSGSGHPLEGALDLYRDANRHGGIRSNAFTDAWSERVRQYQRPDQAGERDADAAALEAYSERVARNHPDVAAIKAPLLSTGNWGGVGLHLRGNIEGYLAAGSTHKWLRIHSGDHVTPFYSLEGRLEQLRFLEHWLKDIDTGITREPPIKLAVRRGGDNYYWRYENEWPLARTEWTPYYLDAAGRSLSTSQPAAETAARFSAAAEAQDFAATFATTAFEDPTEVTGPINLKVWVSSTSDDADLFCVIHNIDPNGQEVTYPGQSSPAIAAAYGWLRVSHRQLDPVRSRPYRPYHNHNELQKLEEGEIVPVEIEVWPASIVFDVGHRLVLEIGSRDDPRIAPFTHTDPQDRIQTGTVSIHTGGSYDSHLLLPLIPPR